MSFYLNETGLVLKKHLQRMKIFFRNSGILQDKPHTALACRTLLNNFVKNLCRLLFNKVLHATAVFRTLSISSIVSSAPAHEHLSVGFARQL